MYMPLSEYLHYLLHFFFGKMVNFEIINYIVFIWGYNTVSIFLKFEVLFYIDCQCPAFHSVLKLSTFN